MKNRIIYIALITVTFMFLCGCSNSEKNSKLKDTQNTSEIFGGDNSPFISAYRKKISKERKNLQKYHGQYKEDVSFVQKNKYQKIDFSESVFDNLPDSNTVCVLNVGSHGISVDEGINLIKKWLADTGHKKVNLKKQLRDAGGQLDMDNSKQYPFNYPSVMENRNKLKSGEGFFVNTNACYLQMGADGFYSVSDGAITKYLKQDGRAGLDAIGENENDIVEEGNYDDMRTKSYELLSGKTSVEKAAGMTRGFFMSGTPFEPEKNISCDIPYVSVFSLGDKYGYAFTMRRTYQNIPFAYTFGGMHTRKSKYAVFEDSKTAYVVDGDTVSAYTGDNEAQPLSVLLEEKEILGLKDAAGLLDKKLAKELRMQLKHVGLVYCRVAIDEAKEIYVVYPCWEFDGLVKNNDNCLRVYMDVLTGDLHMYLYSARGSRDE